MVAHTDDTRQLSALSIAQTRSDILCLQEVDDLTALNAFEYSYLFKMVGQGYKNKYLIDGNDSRGIDVSVMMRDTTHSGHAIELMKLESNAHLTYQELGIYDPVLLNILKQGGFAVNLVERRPVLDRWTLYHTRGPEERHLCQLDYIWASPALAQRNEHAIPKIICNGQPYRTVFPEGQDVVRFPRIGWDRPKASDHCPVTVTLSL